MEIKYGPNFKKSWDKLFHWKYAPYRFFKRIYEFPEDVMAWIHRANHGWNPNDVWGFNTYLATVIRDGIRYLRKNHFCHPMELTDEKWESILDEIAEGFDIFLQDYDDMAETLGDRKKKVERAFRLFIEYFPNLWD